MMSASLTTYKITSKEELLPTTFKHIFCTYKRMDHLCAAANQVYKKLPWHHCRFLLGVLPCRILYPSNERCLQGRDLISHHHSICESPCVNYWIMKCKIVRQQIKYNAIISKKIIEPLDLGLTQASVSNENENEPAFSIVDAFSPSAVSPDYYLPYPRIHKVQWR